MELRLTRPTNGAIKPKNRVRTVNRHGTSLQVRPLLCQINGHQVWADPLSMPFPCETFDSIICSDLLAYVHDDLGTINELARVLKPGGALRFNVPNEGLTSGFDAYNLFRYWSDGTRRGSRPPETDELGWRRHFRNGEIGVMLSSAGLRVVDSKISGTGLSDLVQLSAMIGFRWFKRSEDHYQRVGKVVDRIREYDYRIPMPRIGFSLTIVAVRM